MRYFRCVVGQIHIKMYEEKHWFERHDYHAIVDEVPVFYQLKKDKHSSETGESWRERGTNIISNHAKELGDNVIWIPVRRDRNVGETTIPKSKRLL